LMKQLTGSITLPTYVTIKADGTVTAREFTRDIAQFANFLKAAH